MNESSAENLQTSEPSDARFSLGMLMGSMTILAVVAAMVGAILRSVAPDTRQRLLTLGGIWLAGSIVIGAIAMQQRRAAEQRAGRTILKIPLWPSANDPASFNWIIVARVLFFMLLIVPFASLMITGTPPAAGRDWLIYYAFPVIYPLMITSNVISLLLWNHHVRFCENGVLADRKVLLWSELLEHRFTNADPPKLELKSIDQAHRRPWLKITVESDQAADINELIAENTSAAQKPPTVVPVSLFQASVKEVFIYPHLRRHMVFVALSVTIALSMFYLGWVNPPANREFQDSLMFAVYAWSLVQIWGFRWFVRNSGALNARVFGRRDALGFVLSVGLALGSYYAIDRIVWPIWWLGYVAGTVFVFCAINAAVYYFLTQLDFKPERAIIHGALSWRWETVKTRHWHASRGSLVISKGWRRVTAFVPADQAEAVERLMRERSQLDDSTATDAAEPRAQTDH